MKKFMYVLLRVLEVTLVASLTILGFDGAFYLLNLASTLGNIVGALAAIALSISFLFYFKGFINRILNYIDNQL